MTAPLSVGDLLDYLSRFDPEVEDRIEAASPDEIARLARLAGHELPPDYRAFLARMGRGQGPALSGFRGHIDMGEALELYQETPADERLAGHLMIGRGIMGVYDTLAIDLADGRVVDTDGTRVLAPVAASLPHLLFHQAFLRYELRSREGKLHLGLTGGHASGGDVRALTREQGLDLAGFSDEYNLCARQGEMRLAASVCHPGKGWIALAGGEDERREQVAAHFEKTLPVRRLRR